ncbi:heme-dependent catalase [Thelephora ganbajun]|uniref:Heme-dependent catalase n=1 Tax=Thelephora ganbajun TaxID=370292 RepID=A0ACB6ZCY7_THEGA|nr:heme-dependent catalase [Thelephora ganbajun]
MVELTGSSPSILLLPLLKLRPTLSTLLPPSFITPCIHCAQSLDTPLVSRQTLFAVRGDLAAQHPEVAGVTTSSTYNAFHAHNFSRSSPQAASVLSDLFTIYLFLLTSLCARFTQHFRQTNLAVQDALSAFEGVAVEKICQFDHEHIPKCVIHAHDARAHGHFHVFDSRASRTTPVSIRLSTAQDPRGSMDTMCDIRGFATKFYTPEGNWDIIGNNIPVFVWGATQFPILFTLLDPNLTTMFLLVNQRTTQILQSLDSKVAVPQSYPANFSSFVPLYLPRTHF